MQRVFIQFAVAIETWAHVDLPQTLAIKGGAFTTGLLHARDSLLPLLQPEIL